MGIFFVHYSILAYETCVRFIQKNVLCSLPNCTEELQMFLAESDKYILQRKLQDKLGLN